MSYASSKEDVESDIKADSLEVPALSFDERFAAVDRKKLLRRIDIRIMPIICITYMVVRLDLNSKPFFPKLHVPASSFLADICETRQTSRMQAR